MNDNQIEKKNHMFTTEEFVGIITEAAERGIKTALAQAITVLPQLPPELLEFKKEMSLQKRKRNLIGLIKYCKTVDTISLLTEHEKEILRKGLKVY